MFNKQKGCTLFIKKKKGCTLTVLRSFEKCLIQEVLLCCDFRFDVWEDISTTKWNWVNITYVDRNKWLDYHALDDRIHEFLGNGDSNHFPKIYLKKEKENQHLFLINTDSIYNKQSDQFIFNSTSQMLEPKSTI